MPSSRASSARTTGSAERSTGGRVTLSIRPEKITVDPADADNRFRLRLENVVYVGESSRLILAGALGPEFVVKTDRSPADLNASRGRDIEVGWRARDCLAFAE